MTGLNQVLCNTMACGGWDAPSKFKLDITRAEQLTAFNKLQASVDVMHKEVSIIKEKMQAERD